MADIEARDEGSLWIILGATGAGEIWLEQSWPQLGGVRASVYCVDEKARDRCLHLLDETAPAKRAGRR